ncbi:metal ABC transporter permease [Candidatus Cardinium hertigii]|uniref:Manganese transport system membrane protein MntB n=1 Tax=Candidatus Cardinium hertigii TaxID=247481 RepID=A0A2Z3L9K2_9BACT|nr:metal ABC transporter permease [Candidatus Cardinium hertigii]AWN82037.1 Manganese transport system membrane protein MntB [Candidatus Cardinium hertigii]
MITADAFWTILVATLASINCSLVGTYLILRKVAMVGDAIAHATLPGIVIALLVTGSKHSSILVVGAGMTGLLVTFLIAFLEKKVKVQADAAIGINFTFLFALGVILFSFFSRKIDLDPECSLYGELATVPLDVYRTATGISLGPKAFYTVCIALLINLFFLLIGYKQLFVSTFDPQFAQSIGIRTTSWHYLLMAITALTTVATFEIAGAILVVALLIVPPTTIYLVTKCFKHLLVCSILFAMLMSIGGYYLSCLFNSSMAAAMVTVGGCLFLVVYLFVRFKNR